MLKAGDMVDSDVNLIKNCSECGALKNRFRNTKKLQSGGLKCQNQTCTRLHCLTAYCEFECFNPKDLATHHSACANFPEHEPRIPSPSVKCVCGSIKKRGGFKERGRCINSECATPFHCLRDNCNFESELLADLNIHIISNHRFLIPEEERLEICRCGTPKPRASGQHANKCSNMDCRVYNCLVGECKFEVFSQGVMKKHQKIRHGYKC